MNSGYEKVTWRKHMGEKPTCPAGGLYTLGSVSEKPRCSIPGHTI